MDRDRRYEQRLGTILVVIGVVILLFVLYQAWNYTLNPPTGTYNILTLNGGGGGGNGSNLNGSLNGRFIAAVSFLAIQALAGALILKAGWNLVTPKAETIQVRVKPKSLAVEPVGYSIPPSTASSSPPAGATSGGAAGAPQAPATTPPSAPTSPPTGDAPVDSSPPQG